MAPLSLKVAGISISLVAMLEFDQAIEPIGGSSLRRMANGQAFKSTHWHKHRISLSGSGWVPAPPNAIDYSAPFEIELPHAIGFNAGDAEGPRQTNGNGGNPSWELVCEEA